MVACGGGGGGGSTPSASDGDSAAEPPVVNGPPSISGPPNQGVLVDTVYDFRPAAAEPDGDPLAFSIVNLPRWATFDSVTGRLAGTPSNADVGLYEGIAVSVSDGTDTVTLAFTIEVAAVAFGTITLNWIPTSEREDGSPLIDHGGHKIYWGTTPADYPHVVVIADPGITTYVIEGLLPGAYFVAMSTLDRAGLESKLTPPVRAVIE